LFVSYKYFFIKYFTYQIFFNVWLEKYFYMQIIFNGKGNEMIEMMEMIIKKNNGEKMIIVMVKEKIVMVKEKIMVR